jgi:hypothetical protein
MNGDNSTNLLVVYDKMEHKKSTIIKNVLNVVDLAFDAEERYSRKRDKVRKVFLDEINDLVRWVQENYVDKDDIKGTKCNCKH